MGVRAPRSMNQIIGLYLEKCLVGRSVCWKDANVRLTSSKYPRWTNTTEQKRSLSKDVRRWANKAVFLAGLADALDVSKNPALNGDADGTGNQHCDGLGENHDSGWDLDVMTKFQVAGKLESLFGHGSAINLEDHNGNGSSGHNIAGNELGGDVEIHLLVCDRKENAEGEDKGHGENDGEEVSPEWHIRIVGHGGNRSKDEANGKNGTEPPVGNVTVARHEARVDILLFLGAGAELLHNITPVPQVSVSDN